MRQRRHLKYLAQLVYIAGGLFIVSGSGSGHDAVAGEAAPPPPDALPPPQDEISPLSQSLFADAQALLLKTKSSVARKKAVRLLERVLRWEPNYLPAVIQLAGLYEVRRNPRAAAGRYQHIVRLLKAKKKLATAEQTDLEHAQQRLTELLPPPKVLRDIQRKYVTELTTRATAAVTKKQPYAALRLTLAALQIDPDHLASQKRARALADRLGPDLADSALTFGWQRLHNGKDLTGWRPRTGIWQPHKWGLTVMQNGEFYVFHMSRPRRNFRFQAAVRFRGNSACYLLGRTQGDGQFYGFGVRLDGILPPPAIPEPPPKKGDKRKRKKKKKKAAAPPVANAMPIENRSGVMFFRQENWGRKTVFAKQRFGKAVIRENVLSLLELRCEGDRITALLNGRKMFSVRDRFLVTGGLGILVISDDEDAVADVRYIRQYTLP